MGAVEEEAEAVEEEAEAVEVVEAEAEAEAVEVVEAEEEAARRAEVAVAPRSSSSPRFARAEWR